MMDAGLKSYKFQCFYHYVHSLPSRQHQTLKLMLESKDRYKSVTRKIPRITEFEVLGQQNWQQNTVWHRRSEDDRSQLHTGSKMEDDTSISSPDDSRKWIHLPSHLHNMRASSIKKRKQDGPQWSIIVHDTKTLSSVSEGGTESCRIKYPKQNGKVKKRIRKSLVEENVCCKKGRSTSREKQSKTEVNSAANITDSQKEEPKHDVHP